MQGIHNSERFPVFISTARDMTRAEGCSVYTTAPTAPSPCGGEVTTDFHFRPFQTYPASEYVSKSIDGVGGGFGINI